MNRLRLSEYELLNNPINFVSGIIQQYSLRLRRITVELFLLGISSMIFFVVALYAQRKLIQSTPDIEYY